MQAAGIQVPPCFTPHPVPLLRFSFFPVLLVLFSHETDQNVLANFFFAFFLLHRILHTHTHTQAFRNPQHKDNWSQYWDEGSQCHYYFNKVTQETAWEEPAGGFSVGGGGATDYDTDNPTSEWAEWIKKTDAQSGNDYWYNKNTGATEWCDFVDEDGDGVDDRWDPIHGEDWEERATADGQVYYYNKSTGVTQWKDFVDEDGDGVDDRWDPVADDDWEQRLGADGYTMMWYNLKTGEEYPVEEGGGGGDFDWADWEEATDPATGALYWKNKVTGEVQWE